MLCFPEKILTLPCLSVGEGQKLSQNLLSLQLPLYEEIIEKAPESLHTLIASGDVYIRNSELLQDIPDVDVVCYGLWVDPALATNHGVFVSNRQAPDKLDFMLQKPSLTDLGQLARTPSFSNGYRRVVTMTGHGVADETLVYSRWKDHEIIRPLFRIRTGFG